VGSHTLRTDSDTYQKIQAISFVRGITMTEVLSSAVDYYINNLRPDVQSSVHHAMTAKRSVKRLEGDRNELE